MRNLLPLFQVLLVITVVIWNIALTGRIVQVRQLPRAFVALTALAFYLTERRAQREVSTVMTEQMGITKTTNVLAAVAEVVGLVAASLVVGVVTAIVTARRVFPVLEPRPELAPTVGLTVDPGQLILLAGVVVIAVSLAAAWAQRAASAAQKATVLRG